MCSPGVTSGGPTRKPLAAAGGCDVVVGVGRRDRRGAMPAASSAASIRKADEAPGQA